MSATVYRRTCWILAAILYALVLASDAGLLPGGNAVPYATRIAVVADTPQAAQSAASRLSIPPKLATATYGVSQVADADFQDPDALFFIGRSAGKKTPYVILADASTPPVSVWEAASPSVSELASAITQHVKGGGK